MVFDTESKSVLHTEMAKKNLFVKRGELHLVFFFFRIIFLNTLGISHESDCSKLIKL